MKKKPKIFICLDEPLVIGLIEKAESTIVFAAPSITFSVAEALVKRKHADTNITVSVIVDASPKSLQLGYGEIGGLKLLAESEIEIRKTENLRIGALIIDNRSWIFTPTPEIILEPANEGTVNAINVNQNMTEWLQHAIEPKKVIIDRATREYTEERNLSGSENLNSGEEEADDILNEEFIDERRPTQIADLEPTLTPEWTEPEIGTVTLERAELEELSETLAESPPKKFDHEREILVYNGYLQFIDLKFRGGRLSSRTIRLPDELLRMVKNVDVSVEIKATCKLLENADELCPAIKEFEEKVNKLRRHYAQPLGNELGSVILASQRAAFDKELKELRDELDDVAKKSTETLANAIEQSEARLIEILLPSVLENPPPRLKWRLDRGSDNPTETTIQYLHNSLSELMPTASELVEKMELRSTFKDVTWEMLNEPAFGKAIKDRFPNERFTKLYKERKTIGEKKPKRIITADDWPEELEERKSESGE